MNALYYLYQAWQALHTAKVNYGPAPTTMAPWYGVDELNPDAFRKSIAKAIRSQLTGANKASSILGFKEVRYFTVFMNKGKNELMEYLGFIEETFIDSAFVINTRSATEISESGFYKRVWSDKARLIENLEAFQGMLTDLTLQRTNYHLVSYEKLKVDDEKCIAALGEFIGVEFKWETVRDILRRPHSYRDVGA